MGSRPLVRSGPDLSFAIMTTQCGIFVGFCDYLNNMSDVLSENNSFPLVPGMLLPSR